MLTLPLGALIRLFSSQNFQLALRTALAVTLTAGFGFYPPTADSFDVLSGFIAVGFVLFDCGSPYQGHFFTKVSRSLSLLEPFTDFLVLLCLSFDLACAHATPQLAFRVIGNTLGILWSLAAWFAIMAAPPKNRNLVGAIFELVLASVLVLICRVVAVKSTHALEWALFSLYSFTTYVALSDVCYKQGVEREECDYQYFLLQRFWNLLIAIAVSSAGTFLFFLSLTLC